MWKSTLSRAEPQRYAQVISLVSSGRAAFVRIAIACWLGATAWWRPLALPDEGRYVGVAWEMLHKRDWLVPTLDGLPLRGRRRRSRHRRPTFGQTCHRHRPRADGPARSRADAGPLCLTWRSTCGGSIRGGLDRQTFRRRLAPRVARRRCLRCRVGPPRAAAVGIPARAVVRSRGDLDIRRPRRRAAPSLARAGRLR